MYKSMQTAGDRKGEKMKKVYKMYKERMIALLAIVMILFTMIPMQTMAEDVSVEAAGSTGADKSGYHELIAIDDPNLAAEEDISEEEVENAFYGSSQWNKYGNDYYYNQMDSEQKLFYEKMYTVCMNFLTTSVDASMAYDNGGNPYYRMEAVSYEGLSLTEAIYVYEVLQMNNPQFYFINESYVRGGGVVAACVYGDFAYGSSRAAYTAQFENKVSTWITAIRQQPDVLAMERKAHDIVVENTTYIEGSYNQSAAGVVLDGEAVCAGYAETYALLTNAVGIDTICVTSSDHEWNKSKLYGRWYLVDCTWDDQNPTIYTFFNKSDATIQDNYGGHSQQSFWNLFNVPTAESDTVITTSTGDTSSTIGHQTKVTIYRLYCPVNGEHLYTTDANEKNVLSSWYGWTYEGVGWTAPDSGIAVYRLYNPGLKNHLYTTDKNEVKVLTSQHGWQLDNNGEPLFYSGGSKPIYRLYNEGLAGMHHLTTDYNEYSVLPGHGWKQEGVALYALQ